MSQTHSFSLWQNQGLERGSQRYWDKFSKSEKKNLSNVGQINVIVVSIDPSYLPRAETFKKSFSSPFSFLALRRVDKLSSQIMGSQLRKKKLNRRIESERAKKNLSAWLNRPPADREWEKIKWDIRWRKRRKNTDGICIDERQLWLFSLTWYLSSPIDAFRLSCRCPIHQSGERLFPFSRSNVYTTKRARMKSFYEEGKGKKNSELGIFILCEEGAKHTRWLKNRAEYKKRECDNDLSLTALGFIFFLSFPV